MIPLRAPLRRATATLGLLAGCTPSPSPRQAQQERERIVSVTTVGALVADAWRARTVPDAYAGYTLEKLGREVGQAAASPAWNALPAPSRERMRAAIDQISRLAGKMDSAVSRGDREALGALRERLIAERGVLQAVPVDTTAP